MPRSRKNLPVVSSISSWVEAIRDNSPHFREQRPGCSFAVGTLLPTNIGIGTDSPRECLEALAGAGTALEERERDHRGD